VFFLISGVKHLLLHLLVHSYLFLLQTEEIRVYEYVYEYGLPAIFHRKCFRAMLQASVHNRRK
jgi:hypothetical protein